MLENNDKYFEVLNDIKKILIENNKVFLLYIFAEHIKHLW